MTRVAVALAVVIALAAGVWMLWPDDERAPSTTTTMPLASPSSTTTTTGPTTTAEDDHVVDTVEEAEQILRELWFGWFEGIYNQDVDSIRELVASAETAELAEAQFGVMEFTGRPTPDHIVLSETEILHSDDACLAVWADLDVSALTGGHTSGVHVFRLIEDRWRYVSLWAYRGDLWRDDC